MCLGAAGVIGGFGDAAGALRAAVPTGGHVVIGDLYRRDGVTLEVGEGAPSWLVDAAQSSTTLSEYLDELVRRRLAPVTVVPSSEEDWSTYSSLMWLSIEDWRDENPASPDAPPAERSYIWDLMQHQLGWALMVGRRTSDLEEDR